MVKRGRPISTKIDMEQQKVDSASKKAAGIIPVVIEEQSDMIDLGRLEATPSFYSSRAGSIMGNEARPASSNENPYETRDANSSILSTTSRPESVKLSMISTSSPLSKTDPKKMQFGTESKSRVSKIHQDGIDQRQLEADDDDFSDNTSIYSAFDKSDVSSMIGGSSDDEEHQSPG